jgi:type III restriction enzyme
MARRPGKAAPISLRLFQEECVAALTLGALDTIEKIRLTPANRQRITRAQGYSLLEAPTGSGKTVMLANAAERISRDAPVIWFWFAPFAGVVLQTGVTLNSAASGLRVRFPSQDRALEGTKPGDVFIATWASVAAKKAETRRMREDDDKAIGLSTLLQGLRDAGFAIGVVVDEAHHSFRPGSEAFRFFTETLRPDLVMLATATPDDGDIEILRRALDVTRFQRVSVSRASVVTARLNKQAVQAVSFSADGVGATLVDMNEVALRAAVTKHRELGRALNQRGVKIAPLLLVQAGSEGWTPNRIKELLTKKLDFSADAVAVHTADEPDPDVHALARDPAVEVLIFKMAVATGFDAPRAFVLCALRPVRDPSFGLQVVGRIMRVHPALQSLTELPVQLDTGWVFLGDAEGQSGLVGAATRIKAIKDGISVLTDSVRVVNVRATANGNLVVVNDNGQHELVLTPDPEAPEEEGRERKERQSSEEKAAGLLNRPTTLFGEWAEDSATSPTSSLDSEAPADSARRNERAKPMRFRYERRQGLAVPDRLRTEKMPRDTRPLLQELVRAVRFTSEQLLAARAVSMPVERRETEIFEGYIQRRTEEQGVISEVFARQSAHKVLSVCDSIAPADLGRALMEKLAAELAKAGLEPLDERLLRKGLHVVLGRWPELTREALRKAMAACTEVVDAAPLPEVWESPEALLESPLNLYGVIPQGLNTWEEAFAKWLDRQSDMVRWWTRNPSQPNAHNDWSVRIVLPETGRGFYPDFVVAVDGRKSGLLLAETKERVDSADTEAKTRTEHREYGRALMLAYDTLRAQFYRYEYAFEQQRNKEVGLLRLDDLRD